MRTVYLPLESFDKCKVCNATRVKELRLCSNCGESLYCSNSCQKSDWSSHKKNCGKSIRLDLSSFYPFLACLAEACHRNPGKPPHPAVTHRILNDVNPGSPIHKLPDGSSARLLILGSEVSPESMRDPSSTEWWPSAKSLKVASKLVRRILREGYVLQVCMAICTALVAELYTTTSGAGTAQKRVRMRYKSTPISDFGICVGSVEVKSQDKLAYWLPDGELFKGQDPDDHYWIYFRTMRGEEVILDLAMFPFNLCSMVPTTPYISQRASKMMPFAPAFFLDRVTRNNTPALALHRERRRFSILRNSKIHEAVRSTENDSFTQADIRRLCSVMEGIAGRKCSHVEQDLMLQWMVDSCGRIEDCLKHEDWKGFPEQVKVCIEADPGELDDVDDRDADWYKTMKKWKREHKVRKRTTPLSGGRSSSGSSSALVRV